MTRTWKSITGEQGAWSASVKWSDGTEERLRCVHSHWWVATTKSYFDPKMFRLTSAEDRSKRERWERLIQHTGKVIVTTDKVEEVPGEYPEFLGRIGYVGVFDIADYERTEAGDVSFRFVRRYPRE
jgi:hypothetical protein